MVKKFYPAEALAIAMCLLVITMTVTFFIVATHQESKTILGESSDSQTKTLLDTLTSQFTTLDNTPLFRDIALNSGRLNLNGLNEINKYFVSKNENFNTKIFTQYCNENYLKVNASLELTSDYYMEVRKGKLLIYSLDSNTISNDTPCSLALSFETRGSSSTRFAIQKIYKKGTEYKEYTKDDFTYYCVSDDGNCVYTDNGIDWKNINVRDTINLSLIDSKDGYVLQAIRVIALDGDIAVKSSLSNLSCAGTFDTRFIYLKTYLSCKEKADSSVTYIPYKKYLSYTAITDYTEYKDFGFLNY